MSKCDFNKVTLQSNFIEVTLRHGLSPVILLHIFRTPFHMNTCGGVVLHRIIIKIKSGLSRGDRLKEDVRYENWFYVKTVFFYILSLISADNYHKPLVLFNCLRICSELVFKGIVKRAERCKCDILLVSRII